MPAGGTNTLLMAFWFAWASFLSVLRTLYGSDEWEGQASNVPAFIPPSLFAGDVGLNGFTFVDDCGADLLLSGDSGFSDL